MFWLSDKKLDCNFYVVLFLYENYDIFYDVSSRINISNSWIFIISIKKISQTQYIQLAMVKKKVTKSNLYFIKYQKLDWMQLQIKTQPTIFINTNNLCNC